MSLRDKNRKTEETGSLYEDVESDGVAGAENPEEEGIPVLAPEPTPPVSQARVFLGSLVAEYETDEESPLVADGGIQPTADMTVVEVPSDPVGKASESAGWRTFFQGKRSVAADNFRAQVRREEAAVADVRKTQPGIVSTGVQRPGTPTQPPTAPSYPAPEQTEVRAEEHEAPNYDLTGDLGGQYDQSPTLDTDRFDASYDTQTQGSQTQGETWPAPAEARDTRPSEGVDELFAQQAPARPETTSGGDGEEDFSKEIEAIREGLKSGSLQSHLDEIRAEIEAARKSGRRPGTPVKEVDTEGEDNVDEPRVTAKDWEAQLTEAVAPAPAPETAVEDAVTETQIEETLIEETQVEAAESADVGWDAGLEAEMRVAAEDTVAEGAVTEDTVTETAAEEPWETEEETELDEFIKTVSYAGMELDGWSEQGAAAEEAENTDEEPTELDQQEETEAAGEVAEVEEAREVQTEAYGEAEMRETEFEDPETDPFQDAVSAGVAEAEEFLGESHEEQPADEVTGPADEESAAKVEEEAEEEGLEVVAESDVADDAATDVFEEEAEEEIEVVYGGSDWLSQLGDTSLEEGSPEGGVMEGHGWEEVGMEAGAAEDAGTTNVDEGEEDLEAPPADADFFTHVLGAEAFDTETLEDETLEETPDSEIDSDIDSGLEGALEGAVEEEGGEEAVSEEEVREEEVREQAPARSREATADGYLYWDGAIVEDPTKPQPAEEAEEDEEGDEADQPKATPTDMGVWGEEEDLYEELAENLPEEETVEAAAERKLGEIPLGANLLADEDDTEDPEQEDHRQEEFETQEADDTATEEATEAEPGEETEELPNLDNSQLIALVNEASQWTAPFRDTQMEYVSLWYAYHQGNLEAAELRSRASELRVLDGDVLWTLGFQTGQWYRKGQGRREPEWVADTPPTQEAADEEARQAEKARVEQIRTRMAEAEKKARKILRRYAAGRLHYNDTREALAELKITEGDTEYALGVQTGRWYYETEDGYIPVGRHTAL